MPGVSLKNKPADGPSVSTRAYQIGRIEAIVIFGCLGEGLARALFGERQEWGRTSYNDPFQCLIPPGI